MVAVSRVIIDVTERLLTVTVRRMSKNVVSTLLGMVVVALDSSGVTEHLLTVTVPRMGKTVVTTLLGW